MNIYLYYGEPLLIPHFLAYVSVFIPWHPSTTTICKPGGLSLITLQTYYFFFQFQIYYYDYIEASMNYVIALYY